MSKERISFRRLMGKVISIAEKDEDDIDKIFKLLTEKYTISPEIDHNDHGPLHSLILSALDDPSVCKALSYVLSFLTIWGNDIRNQAPVLDGGVILSGIFLHKNFFVGQRSAGENLLVQAYKARIELESSDQLHLEGTPVIIQDIFEAPLDRNTQTELVRLLIHRRYLSDDDNPLALQGEECGSSF